MTPQERFHCTCMYRSASVDAAIVTSTLTSHLILDQVPHTLATRTLQSKNLRSPRIPSSDRASPPSLSTLFFMVVAHPPCSRPKISIESCSALGSSLASKLGQRSPLKLTLIRYRKALWRPWRQAVSIDSQWACSLRFL